MCFPIPYFKFVLFLQYLQGTTSVRSNQSAYYRPPTMPAPTRSSTHQRHQPSHIFQPHVPVVYTQQIPPPTVPGIGIQNSHFPATYQPRTSQNFFPLPYPTIPSQPIFGFGSNQQATQQCKYSIFVYSSKQIFIGN